MITMPTVNQLTSASLLYGIDMLKLLESQSKDGER